MTIDWEQKNVPQNQWPNRGTFQEFSSQVTLGERANPLAIAVPSDSGDRFFFGFGVYTPDEVILNGSSYEYFSFYYNDMFKYFENAEDEMFSWIGGSDKSNEETKIALRDEYSTENIPSGRAWDAAFSDFNGDNIILIGGEEFGGYLNSYYTNDVWLFDVISYGFKRIFENRNTFEEQEERSTLWEYDESNQMTQRSRSCQVKINELEYYIYGGFNRPSLYKYVENYTAWENTTGNVTVKHYALRNRTVQGSQMFFGDIWGFSTLYNMFKLVFRNENYLEEYEYYNEVGVYNEFNTPPQRSFPFCWSDDEGETMSIFGGFSFASPFMGDFWTYNITKKQWKIVKEYDFDYAEGTIISSPGFAFNNTPGGRYGGIYFESYIDSVYYYILIGGFGVNVDYDFRLLGDVEWLFNPATEEWSPWNRTIENAGDGVSIYVRGFTVSSDNVLYTYGGIERQNSSIIDNGGDIWSFSSALSVNSRISNDCGANAYLNDEGNCTCYEGYSKSNSSKIDCDLYFCQNISTSSENVCSQSGICIGPDECSCYRHIYGDECQYFQCYKYKFDSSSVCGTHGECVDVDDCSCYSNDGYYGKECKEWIGVAFEHTSTVVKVEYIVAFSSISEYLDSSFRFDCSLFVVNTEILGSNIEEDAFCYVEYDLIESMTKYIIIYSQSNTSTLGLGSHLYLQPLLKKDSSSPTTDILRIVQKSESDDGSNASLVAILASVLSILVFGCIFCVCGILACLLFSCLLVGTGGVAFIQKKKLKKFDSIDGIDLILKEQKLEKDKSVAHLRITKELFEIENKDLKLVSIIGSGGSESTIYKAKWNNREVAFKCFKTRTICNDQDTFDEFEREVSILASLSHPGIICFYGAIVKPPRVGFVMEFAKNGDLGRHIKILVNEKREEDFTVLEKLRIVGEISETMEYLHSKNIIHRDLKCENVLLTETFSTKVMDFGLSKIYEQSDKNTTKTKGVGTCVYMSPEITKGHHYNHKCDVYSFGMLLWVIFAMNTRPYGDEVGVEFKVANNPFFRPKIELTNAKQWLKNLIMICWDDNPQKRWEFKQITDWIAKGTKKYHKEEEKKKNFEEEGEKSSLLFDDLKKSDEFSHGSSSGRSNSTTKTEGLVIFLRTREERDSEAERFVMIERSMECLLEMIHLKWMDQTPRAIWFSKTEFEEQERSKGKVVKNRFSSVFQNIKRRQLMKVTKDEDISLFHQNSLIIVDFPSEKGQQKEHLLRIFELESENQKLKEELEQTKQKLSEFMKSSIN